MNTILLQFAVATEGVEEAGLFGSLGIDWTLLLMQTIAFLVLLAILRKWVYPPLLAMLDKRDKLLRDSTEAAVSAKKRQKTPRKKLLPCSKKPEPKRVISWQRHARKQRVLSKRRKRKRPTKPRHWLQRHVMTSPKKLNQRAYYCIMKRLIWWRKRPGRCSVQKLMAKRTAN